MKKIKYILKKKNKYISGLKLRKKNIIDIKILGHINKNLNIYNNKFSNLIQYNKLGYNISKKNIYYNLFFLKKLL